MSDQDKVIFLAHRNDQCKTAVHEFLACGHCANKAWTVAYEHQGAEDSFPRLRCTCCGWDGGRFGWVRDE